MHQHNHANGTSAKANADAVREARAIYQRVLAGWAMDVLELRRGGLDRPSLRCAGETMPMTPHRRAA